MLTRFRAFRDVGKWEKFCRAQEAQKNKNAQTMAENGEQKN